MNSPFTRPAFRILPFLIVLTTVCNAQLRSDTTHASGWPDPDPYALTLKLEGSVDEGYRLVAHVALDSGSWFTSPFFADRYKGHFALSLKNNDGLLLDGTIDETPRSAPQLYKWEEPTAGFVKQNTSYGYGLTLNSEENFKILGMVRFVIEPKCTLEEIPFSISQKAGKLTIQQYPKLDKTTCTKVN